MKTSQYASDDRKNLKRFQRSSGYAIMKREHTALREKLETKLRERNEVIKRLTEKLVEAGVAAEEVAKIAA